MAGLSAAMMVATNLFLVVASNASPSAIGEVLKIRAGLRHVPAGVAFRCDRGAISVISYDPVRDRETERPVYQSKFPFVTFLRWSGGNRSPRFLARRVRSDL